VIVRSYQSSLITKVPATIGCQSLVPNRLRAPAMIPTALTPADAGVTCPYPPPLVTDGGEP
jgi:hypothetical protein